MPTCLTNAIVVANGKGGVGKTSVVANVGGLAAAGGWKVLAVDLDPQGNLGRDLGYLTDGRSDRGQALFAAIQAHFAGHREPPEPLRDVRPNLDVIPGGTYTRDLNDILARHTSRNLDAIKVLQAVLEPLAASYNLLLFDCPPRGDLLQDAALAASRRLVVPTTFDDGSVDGLTLMAEAVQEARVRNPDLELLGVVLFNFASQARQLVREVTEEVTAGLGDIAPVWRPAIRSAPRAARDTRRRGLLAHEYEAAALAAASSPRDGQRPVDQVAAAEIGLVAGSSRRYSSAAGTLAGDYQQLADQLLEAFVAGVRASTPQEPQR
jgi:chromosome partitioning protein